MCSWAEVFASGSSQLPCIKYSRRSNSEDFRMRIRKAVFPVAGLGTRFLPATKASAKEILPVVDKPLVQYAVQEAIAAGAEEMIFITSHTKNSIMDHFDRDYELESLLEAKGKNELLKAVRDVLPPGISRSEEHTSELQSRGHLVCRLLLEKKKKSR